MCYQVCLTSGYLFAGWPILAFAGAGPPALGDRAVGAAPNLILRGDQGPLAGRKILVTTSPFAIGRSPDNDLVLPEAQVSRRHARLERREGRWWLQDLGSANGTLVNRQQQSPTQAVPVTDGDVIAIGESVFTVLLQAAARPAAVPPRAAQAAARPRRISPVAAIAVGLVLVAVVALTVWALLRQVEKEEEIAPGPGLPTVVLPKITVPAVQIPTVNLPTVGIPTALPIPTAAKDLLAPLQTALPELKLPARTPVP